MATNKAVEVSKLKLDLKNYRTVPQRSEKNAIAAMIAIKPERFFAIIESLISDGYLPTENLIVLDNNGMVVKEGNRRLGALKIIHGIYKPSDFSIPDNIKAKITSIPQSWKKENLKIPCTVYKISEVDKVSRIVNLTHAKGEKASRFKWGSIATARHNRDEKNANEPTLDLLEKYLKKGQNLTVQQKSRWAGDFPLTVLNEAIRVILDRIGYATIKDLAKAYPKCNYKDEIEGIIRAIGLEIFGYKEIRDKNTDFALPYGIPLSQPTQTPTSGGTQTKSTATNTGKTSGKGTKAAQKTSSAGKSPTSTKPAGSFAIADPKQVTVTLKKFNPKGSNRQKVITLRDELINIKLAKNPLAFCFLLRSIFEISAKIYCKENSISTTKSGGRDKKLVEILRSATNHITQNDPKSPMVKVLHGAMAEMAKPNGMLSVTSMNQLVHNPKFSVIPKDVAVLFGNIYPLLEAMN